MKFQFPVIINLCAWAALLLLSCSNDSQSPYTQEKSKIFLVMQSSKKVISDTSIADTAGNIVRIGLRFYMPTYFDSAVITISKSTKDIDTYFVCSKTDCLKDTAWFEDSLRSAGVFSVTAIGYVQGGLRPSASGTITVFARPVVLVNHKPSLIITGRKNITTAEGCTLFVSANHEDTGQALSYSVIKSPAGYSFNNQLYIWKPASENDTGVDSVTFVVSDNGTPILSDTQKISILVIKKLFPPNPVDSLRVFDKRNGYASLCWRGVANADSFIVFHSTYKTSGYALRGSTKDTLYKDQILSNEFYYYIQAKNSAGISFSDTIFSGDYTFIDTIKPYCTGAVIPADSADSVEYLNGVTLKWTVPTGIFRDTLHYIVNYGADNSTFTAVTTKNDSIIVNGLQGGIKYRWYILIVAGKDTARCPIDAGTYHVFTAKNHPADITGFTDKKASINDSISLNVAADDKEGIREYRWDFDGDGVVDKTTAIGAVSFKTPALPNTYAMTLTVVDNAGGKTIKTASLVVTNEKPVVNAGPDTIFVGYKKPVTLHPTATDDGTSLTFAWDFQGNGIYTTVTKGDTTFIPPQSPTKQVYRLKVTDDDGNSMIDSVIAIVKMMWTIAAQPDNFPTAGFSVATTDSMIVVTGGSRSGIKDSGIVWRSADGTNWSQVTPKPQFGYRYNHSTIGHRAQLFLVGGIGHSDFWNSTDNGTNWNWLSLVDSSGSIENSAVFMEGLFVQVAGGSAGLAPSSRWLTSLLGQGWMAYDSVSWGPSSNIVQGMDKDTVFIAEGDKSELWVCLFDRISSSLAWKKRSSALPFSFDNKCALCSYRGVLYFFVRNQLYISQDRGVSWSLITNDFIGTSNYLRAVVFKDKMYLFSLGKVFTSQDTP